MLVEDTITLRGKTLTGFRRIDPVHASQLHREILKEAAACGCEAGTAGSLVALGIYLLGSVVVPVVRSHQVRASWGTAIGVLLGGAALGKVLGLTLSRRRLDQLLLEFVRRREEAVLATDRQKHSSPIQEA
jgi:hypothetical protein